MESRPVEVYPVHDHLRSRLCSLYENDSIFDKFECGWNGSDKYPYFVQCLSDEITVIRCNIDIVFRPVILG